MSRNATGMVSDMRRAGSAGRGDGVRSVSADSVEGLRVEDPKVAPLP
jgi:hypothetical protein